MADIGLIVLAAGASSRMGTAKQLLPYRGTTLLEHILHLALNSVCHPVIVVLGANAEQIKPKLTTLDVKIVQNANWSKGLSTSIRVGIEALQAETANLDGVLLALGDQPLISTQFINQLVETFKSSEHLIVASEYAGILGVPALFHHTLIPELLTLTKDAGARFLIQKYRKNTLGILNLQAQWDIDTPIDYKKLLAMPSSTAEYSEY